MELALNYHLLRCAVRQTAGLHGASHVSLVTVLPAHEQRALRWRGAERASARAEHVEERLTAARYLGIFTAKELHKFVRHYNVSAWNNSV
jgi:hypothetical protein